MRAKCDKVDWRVETLKDYVQPRRTQAKFSEGHSFSLTSSSAALQSTIRTAQSAVATASCVKS